MPVTTGGHGKPVGDLYAFRGQFAVHLTERCVLPPDQADVLVPDVGKPANVDRVLLHALPPPAGGAAGTR